jgi:hypothetical protein
LRSDRTTPSCCARYSVLVPYRAAIAVTPERSATFVRRNVGAALTGAVVTVAVAAVARRRAGTRAAVTANAARTRRRRMTSAPYRLAVAPKPRAPLSRNLAR